MKLSAKLFTIRHNSRFIHSVIVASSKGRWINCKPDRMQEAFVNINEIPTHVMTWGKWIEESFADHEREVVICITGNPGLPGFYTQFLSTLHNNLDAKTPVWVIGEHCIRFHFNLHLSYDFLLKVTQAMTNRPRRVYARCRRYQATNQSSN